MTTTLDVDDAVTAAREAFEDGPWPAMSLAERSEQVLAIAEALVPSLEEAIDLQIDEMASPRRFMGPMTLGLVGQIEREVEAAPGHASISHSWLWRAFAHVRADRWEEALAVYEQLLDLTPDNAAPNIGRAVCCQHLGRLDDARASMLRARRAEPVTPLATWRMRWGRALRDSPQREAFLGGLDAAWAATETQTA